MGFDLSDEQLALREMTERFVREEIVPKAAHHDATGEYPREIGRKAFELGLMNITVPEDYGGGGLGHLEEAIVTEELCYGCAGIAICITVNNLATVPLAIAGSEALKKRYLGMLTSDHATASYCLSEPDAGSDAAAIATTAQRKGDRYVISGSKAWVTGGPQARWFVLFAKTDRSLGSKGVSAFIVPADSPGIRIGKKEDMMGQRASSTVFIDFEEVAVPADHLLGAEGDGFRIAMKTFDRTRPGIAAGAVGVARRATDEAIRYAKERKAFGKPISEHQAVQFLIADMYKECAAARLLTWHAAWKIDRGERNTLECSIAKCFGADAAMRVTTDAVQVFGGYGYSKEFPVEKLMRDAKVLQIYEGTNQIQRLIIARQVLGS
ncbi:MAG: acyl-CoA dehydrogenase family protein [Planctomycetes bacterium]|nr:acyl-CoA dehydrogenase family protein [Planctomycetota bacterium]